MMYGIDILAKYSPTLTLALLIIIITILVISISLLWNIPLRLLNTFNRIITFITGLYTDFFLLTNPEPREKQPCDICGQSNYYFKSRYKNNPTYFLVCPDCEKYVFDAPCDLCGEQNTWHHQTGKPDGILMICNKCKSNPEQWSEERNQRPTTGNLPLPDQQSPNFPPDFPPDSIL